MNEMRKPRAPINPGEEPQKPHVAPFRMGSRSHRSHPEHNKIGAAPATARAPFRTRLFAVLLLFALVPSLLVTVAWVLTTSRTLPLVGASDAWDRIGATGERAVSTLADAPLTDTQREVLRVHEDELRRSMAMAKRVSFVVPNAVRLIALAAFVLLLGVALGASRVAGHLARQLSRPLDELVGWTGMIRAGSPLPSTTQRGAPEFAVLRSGMRTMATELEQGRRQALEAERAEAFRESARRFAHELKNPLTPIRFAVDRLRRGAPPELLDTIEVLAEESARLETMARSFAQFGRLPDGPASEIDLADLVTRAAQATVPDHLTLALNIAPELPLVRGLHDPLARALTNVLINAVDVSPPQGTIGVTVAKVEAHSVCIEVKDSGPGIEASQLERVFDPYVTTKPGGTGLGLAIVRQTMQAHGGRVEVQSTIGVGTTMRLVLPINAAVAAVRPLAQQASGADDGALRSMHTPRGSTL